MELSIILTAHNEGLLAHKTMLSVFRALEDFEQKYEILIHIDNGSTETKKYFSRYRNDSRIRILENKFGDAGASRNFCVKEAHGKYLLFVDADDLISKNYVKGLLEILHEAKEPTIAHPETCITFEDGGEEYLLWKTGNSLTRERDAFVLFERNRWVSSLAARKEVFLEHPYVLTENGLGHEDYTFNIETTAAGIKHEVAKGTLFFYRNKKFSVRHEGNNELKTQPWTELFDYKFWQTFDVKPTDLTKTHERTAMERIKQSYVEARKNPKLNRWIEPAAKAAKRLTKKPFVSVRLPEATFREWSEMSKIEQQLYPTQEKLKRLIHYDSEANCYLSYAYEQLCRQVQDYPDYMFLVPWIMPGGADKVLINYLKALQEIHPEWKVAVVTTTVAPNTWAKKLPENAYLLDMGNIMKDFDQSNPEVFLMTQMNLFTRLIVQLKVKKLHIINASLGYEWVQRHAEFVKNNVEVYLSLFCHDILPNTKGKGTWDYADPYAMRIDPLVKRIYTDNEAVVKKLVENDGFDAKKIRVHYQPTEMMEQREFKAKENQKINILWASRITPQKNPELLLEIAKKLDARKFHIDAFGRKDGDYPASFFPKSVKSLTYHGSFNGVKSLDLNKYDIFLYTSLIDGVPNVILEMAGAGVPIVASDAGGVRDFIKDGETGFLIEDLNNADKYVEVLEKIHENPEVLQGLAENAHKKLKQNHSWETFVKTISEDF